MGGTQSSYSVQVSNRLSNQASHIGQLSAASRLHASAVESQLSRDAEKGQLPVVYWEESSIKELGLSGRGGHGLATFVELGLPDGQQVPLVLKQSHTQRKHMDRLMLVLAGEHTAGDGMTVQDYAQLVDDGKETVAEAEIARNVQHPNVVRMHALLKSRASLPGGPFSADVVLGSLSEAAVNGSLASLLEFQAHHRSSQASFAVHHLTPDVLDLHLSLVGGMAIQLLQALEAMCAAGIAHRDVCPDNVVMDVGEPLQGREVQMKLIDFGEAHHMQYDARKNLGPLVGHDGYLDLHQLSQADGQGYAPISERNDFPGAATTLALALTACDTPFVPYSVLDHRLICTPERADELRLAVQLAVAPLQQAVRMHPELQQKLGVLQALLDNWTGPLPERQYPDEWLTVLYAVPSFSHAWSYVVYAAEECERGEMPDMNLEQWAVSRQQQPGMGLEQQQSVRCKGQDADKELTEDADREVVEEESVETGYGHESESDAAGEGGHGGQGCWERSRQSMRQATSVLGKRDRCASDPEDSSPERRVRRRPGVTQADSPALPAALGPTSLLPAPLTTAEEEEDRVEVQCGEEACTMTVCPVQLGSGLQVDICC